MTALTGEENLWGVYLVRCADGTLYCGATRDVARRLAEHNGKGPGARYTRSRRPVALVHFTGALFSQGEALRLEWRIKRLPRTKKLAALQRITSAPWREETAGAGV